MLFTAQFDDDCLGKLKQIASFEKRTMSSMVRYLVELHYQKIFGLISSIDKNQAEQPAQPAPAAPAARHVPTVEEVLAMRKPDASEACWEFWGDWTEEQRRALIGPLEITRSVLDERFGLSPDDEPYGDD